VPLFLESLV